MLPTLSRSDYAECRAASVVSQIYRFRLPDASGRGLWSFFFFFFYNLKMNLYLSKALINDYYIDLLNMYAWYGQ